MTCQLEHDQATNKVPLDIFASPTEYVASRRETNKKAHARSVRAHQCPPVMMRPAADANLSRCQLPPPSGAND